MLCFAGVAVFGAIQGIGLAIVVAVIEFLWDGWRPYFAVLGRVNGLRGYHDLRRYPEARLVPGLLIFRWDAPLFFANSELFNQSLTAEIAKSPTPVRRVILAAEPITSVDVTAADMLAGLEAGLRQNGIELRFAEMKDPVKDKLRPSSCSTSWESKASTRRSGPPSTVARRASRGLEAVTGNTAARTQPGSDFTCCGRGPAGGCWIEGRHAAC